MPQFRTSLVALVASVGLSGALLVVPASDAAPVRATTVAKPSSAYVVKPGVTFNSPFGSNDRKRAIITKINTALRHAKDGSEVRIFSWKIFTKAGVDAALAAQKRGAVVRVLMDKSNTIEEDNPHFRRLRAGLKAGNGKKPAALRSGARLCQNSCRGKGGAAHAKYMLFSHTGKSRDVVMMSSANWGDPAANLQWNDMYTFVDSPNIYMVASEVFDQAWKDEPVKKPWTEYTTDDGRTVVAWSPTTTASRADDRLLATLDKVKCRGATGGAGNANGRTIIRTTPDVIRNERGMQVARQLRRLWDSGCDVRIGYTVMGKDVSRLLRASGPRGPVPIRHLTQDYNGDGIFDRYFHLKAYTINGHIGKNTEAYWMVAGSANTSSLALYSDEQQIYFIDRRSITLRYQKHMDYWIKNFPASTTSSSSARRVAGGEVDPYATMELD